MASACPFAKTLSDASSKECPAAAGSVGPKCPFGYDAQTFKLGPFSCMLCQSLLFDSTRCVPCAHVFCKVCLSPFKDCPLCGADIDSTEPDADLQSTVDRFIQGHARIKRSQVEGVGEDDDAGEKKTVVYGDVSLERGSFLLQQAVRAFRAKNVESAKARLVICAEDIRDQISKSGKTSELCSQLGAVLGLLGDCCRALGEGASAVAYFEESVEFLSQLPLDTEVTHTLSVSLNKIGDVNYYDGNLQAARSYYDRSLNVRRDAIKNKTDVPSQILDVVVSLAKVADVDRSLGNEDTAIEEFQEGIKLLETLNLKPEETALEQRRQQVLEFINSQLAEK